MSKTLFTVGFWLLAGSSANAAEAVNEKNWVDHPEIVEVRLLYQKVKESKDAGQLKKKERKFDYCEPYEDTDRTLYLDRNEKPRIYSYAGGSDDSAVQRELYYDESGKLRFAFITAGAHNGTKLEHRVYFSSAERKSGKSRSVLRAQAIPSLPSGLMRN